MKGKAFLRILILLGMIVLILSFIKLPFYVTQPGMTSELEPIIEIENGFNDEKGSFSLTTIRFGRANPLTYMWAKLHDFYYIQPIEEIRREEETDEEYFKRQLHMMETSQESAITVAYQKANKQIDYLFHGIYVDGIVKDMPAAKVLEVGDRIYKMDNVKFQTAEQFIDFVGQKKEGEEITIFFEREGKPRQGSLKLETFTDDPTKVGIGISLTTDRELIVSPDIKLNTEDIGGPSAGLMMSLEIYGQLTEGDLTKGYSIAGTGTINPSGEVGPIGGISQKIVAADRAGMDIFFAPNENGKTTSNYREAVKVAKKIKTDMQIVPVDSFDDAVSYLMKLKEKG